jgi:AraC-like DNA-binding protein
MDIEPVLRMKLKYNNFINLDDKNFEYLIPALNSMNRIYIAELDEYKTESDNQNNFILLNSLTLYIITYISNYHNKIASEIYLQKNKKSSHPLFYTLEYIHNHFCEKLCYEDLSKISNLSVSTFLRYFKTAFSISPNVYIRNLRLEYSKKLLLLTNAPIVTIANECGFFDSTHFELFFKRKYNFTPKQFREQFKQKK